MNGLLNCINNARLASSSIPLEILDKTGLIKYCQMLQEFVVRLQAGREFSECTTWSSNDGMVNQDKCEETHGEVCNGIFPGDTLVPDERESQSQFEDVKKSRMKVCHRTKACEFLNSHKRKKLCSFCRTKHEKGFMYCPSYGTICDFCQKLNHSHRACWYKYPNFN